MKISWIKSKQDTESFKMFKALGMDVYEIEDLEKTDEKIADLVKQKYETIVISDQLSAFSNDIVKKYRNNDKVNIIIASKKQNLD